MDRTHSWAPLLFLYVVGHKKLLHVQNGHHLHWQPISLSQQIRIKLPRFCTVSLCSEYLSLSVLTHFHWNFLWNTQIPITYLCTHFTTKQPTTSSRRRTTTPPMIPSTDCASPALLQPTGGILQTGGRWYGHSQSAQPRATAVYGNYTDCTMDIWWCCGLNVLWCWVLRMGWSTATVFPKWDRLGMGWVSWTPSFSTFCGPLCVWSGVLWPPTI